MRLFGTQEIRNNQFYMGGVSMEELKETYGTPLYVMDEQALTENMRLFQESFRHERLDTEVIYASKAFMNRAMVRLLKDSGLSLDVVSGGELYTAAKEDFPRERIYFHGNNKSPEEIAYALKEGIGTFIVDHELEFQRIALLLKADGRPQRILLRVNPGIEAHTHEYISTTKNDSKFGLSIFDEATADFIKKMASDARFDFRGLHCHIGSQIFEEESFLKAAKTMVEYMRTLSEKGVQVRELNLGGGFGVHYVQGDEPLNLKELFAKLLAELYALLEKEDLLPVKIMIEPGRSIAATAGVTLYEVGSVKKTFGGMHYVFVDGSMADHIRTALYDASYTAKLTERMMDPPEDTFRITGKACESGDILVKEIRLPLPRPGELLAVFSTGAYHYSMASNYNRLTKPPVVFVKDGSSRLVVRRETYEDLIRNDL
ncbi:diaminopimelate decarboxylase [Proteiniclasticum ruminis]|uniref:diaminopimelate decarboxylase n=1 Tax=Proteiniclasticum ruminis TaxID=398199 RepID=UPI0028AB369B|nr:diaminopimelate decarboxylase [Proteiniclasticum ruminis]